MIADSFAICEYAAELSTTTRLWPDDRAARARARSVSAEMHAGFAALRRDMPMNLCGSFPGAGHTREALADAERIGAIWRECRSAQPARGGPFLFGAFTIADAMVNAGVYALREYACRSARSRGHTRRRSRKSPRFGGGAGAMSHAIG